jgi:hypothetical protein
MRRPKHVLVATALAVLASLTSAHASWLSDITGVDVNVPRGTVTFGPPRPDSIPQMLQNLPKDVATFFLNPAGSALALAIRQAKEQARQNCSPMPAEVTVRLASFFPADLFPGVCWAVVANGFTLDAFAIHDGGMAAITLEDVVVFRSSQDAADAVLWSHELTHVLQYRRMGVEGFAAVYASGGFDALEQQARQFDQFVAARLQADANARYWQTANGWSPTQQISFQQYAAAARQAVNPFACSRFQLGPGFVDVINNCPIPIRVTGFAIRQWQTGFVSQIPCTTNLCFVGAGTYSRWPETPYTNTANVFIVW